MGEDANGLIIKFRRHGLDFAADVSWISKFPGEDERLLHSAAMFQVESVEDDGKDGGVQRVTVRAANRTMPDAIAERCRNIQDRDPQMLVIRADPEIKRYEAWRNAPETGQPFRSKNDEIHRRFRSRRADLYEMVARDEDL